MSKGPINLNKARKARARAERRDVADRNAVKFGRKKVEKQRDAKAAEIVSRFVDRHKLEE